MESSATFSKAFSMASLGMFAMILAQFSLVSLLVLRWIESGHFPLSNLYESLMFLSWSFTFLYLFLDNIVLKRQNPFLGCIISPCALFTNAFASFTLPSEMQQSSALVPALQSNWLMMHVTVMILSYTALILGSLLAVAFLILVNITKKTAQWTSFSSIEKNWKMEGNSIVNLGNKVNQLRTLDFSFLSLLPLPFFDQPTGQKTMNLLVALFFDQLVDQKNIADSNTTDQLADQKTTNPFLSISTVVEVVDEVTEDKKTKQATANVTSKEVLRLLRKQSKEKDTDTFFNSVDPNLLDLSKNLDNLSYRILGIGFPLLTIGILSGAVWANEAWGSYWSWDPKETWALLTWLVFAIYLHTRLNKGWEGERPAIIASVGFITVWICFLGVNLIGEGLHSYGWFSK
jgi:cytochrome c-type biogenesis protein CcsB